MVDELDMRIIEEMQTDARKPARQIGNKLGIAHTTVQRRIKKLIDSELIRLVIIPNWEVFGYQVWAHIRLDVTPGWTEHVIKNLINHPACYSVSEILTPDGVYIGTHFKLLEELTQFTKMELPKVGGIEYATVDVVTRVHRYYTDQPLVKNTALNK